MNIVINKYIFAYLCVFYSLTKYFHEFQSIFVKFRFTDILSKYPSIFNDIFYISVKYKYRYIRNYQYFVSWWRERGRERRAHFPKVGVR